MLGALYSRSIIKNNYIKTNKFNHTSIIGKFFPVMLGLAASFIPILNIALFWQLLTKGVDGIENQIQNMVKKGEIVRREYDERNEE